MDLGFLLDERLSGSSTVRIYRSVNTLYLIIPYKYYCGNLQKQCYYVFVTSFKDTLSFLTEFQTRLISFSALILWQQSYTRKNTLHDADDNGKHVNCKECIKKYFTIIIISIHVHITPRVLVKSPFHLVSVSEVQYHVRFLKTRFTSSTRANGLPQKKLKAEAISSPKKICSSKYRYFTLSKESLQDKRCKERRFMHKG